MSGSEPIFVPAQDHLSLGSDFFDPVRPAAFPQHILRYRNEEWAGRVGLGGLSETEWISHFGRFEPLPGSLPEPLALRYHGHQFQTYNPDLGDGRGFLFAQLRDPGTGRLLDLATKGSGRTPWSRTADGRLTLKGAVREVLATAMLEALGVDTSKSFSVIETGEALVRGDEPSPTRSAVLTRLSHGHIRIGTFQRLAFLKDRANLEKLLDYCVTTYLPEAQRPDLADRAAAFLAAVTGRVARTGARWIAAGFVHGVLNTDNINITGESFDYGPWRFLPAYDPGFTAAYFDQTGLYAFGRQPDALAWNLTRLAECLVPLAGVEKLEPALNTFWSRFQAELAAAVLERLGLAAGTPEDVLALMPVLFEFLSQSQVGYEQFFFDWRGGVLSQTRALQGPAAAFYSGEAFDALHALIAARTPVSGPDHPYFARSVPRTMLIDEVEAIWAPIAERDDWGAFTQALDEIDAMARAYGQK